jgi:hypothetical protein
MSVQVREIKIKRRKPRWKRARAPEIVQVRRKPRFGQPSNRFIVVLAKYEYDTANGVTGGKRVGTCHNGIRQALATASDRHVLALAACYVRINPGPAISVKCLG